AGAIDLEGAARIDRVLAIGGVAALEIERAVTGAEGHGRVLAAWGFGAGHREKSRFQDTRSAGSLAVSGVVNRRGACESVTLVAYKAGPAWYITRDGSHES